MIFFFSFFNEMLGPPSTVTDIYVNQSNANWLNTSVVFIVDWLKNKASSSKIFPPSPTYL